MGAEVQVGGREVSVMDDGLWMDAKKGPSICKVEPLGSSSRLQCSRAPKTPSFGCYSINSGPTGTPLVLPWYHHQRSKWKAQPHLSWTMDYLTDFQVSVQFCHFRPPASLVHHLTTLLSHSANINGIINTCSKRYVLVIQRR